MSYSPLACAAALAAATVVFNDDAVGQHSAPRDPMVPPAAAQASASRAAAPDTTAAAAAGLRQILVVDGQHYVVDGVRRRGVGDLLGGARIERIDDSGAWVRDAGTLRRMPLYAGVAKKVAAESAAAPEPAASAARPRQPTLARAP